MPRKTRCKLLKTHFSESITFDKTPSNSEQMDQIIGLTKDLKCITQLSQFKQMSDMEV